MSFSDAFKFPFQRVNFSKILTIVLVFLIVAISFAVISLTFKAPAYFLLIPPSVLIFGLFVGGYSIAIIQNLLQGETVLPEISIWRDLGRGVALVIGGIIYSIPFILVYACAFSFFGITAVSTTNVLTPDTLASPDSGAGVFMALCGLFSILTLGSIALGYAFIVGMVRYAATDSSNGLYDVVGNVRYVLGNLGKVINLIIFQIVLGIVYALISGFVSGIFVMILFGIFGNSPSNDTVAIGMVTIIYLIALTANIMSLISSLYLFAQFGTEIGILDGDLPKAKRKHDFDDIA